MHPSVRLFSGALLFLIAGRQPGAQAQAAPTNTANLSLDQATQSVIEGHPLIRYQEAQVQIDRGLKLQASAAFDTVINLGLSQARTTLPLTSEQSQQFALIGVAEPDELTDLTQSSLGVSRLFRSGVSLGESLTVNRNVDNVANPGGINTANPNVQLTIPLLRGRGRDAVAAQETAAEIEINAGTLDLTNQIATLLTDAASAYWNLVANRELLHIAREAENRAITDRENTRTLVDADRLPRGNLNEVDANVAQSASARIGAEQNLVEAQYQLAADIGLDRDAIASTLLVPSDDFPALAADAFPQLTLEALQAYVEIALTNRSDYLALQKRIDEDKVLVVAAKNRLQPELNLTANGGYNGLQEGRRFKDIFTSPGKGVDGPNASLGIAYSFPPRNEAARGAYMQALATQTQTEAQKMQLRHTITSAVAGSARAVRNAALQAGRAHAAVGYYTDSLHGQREKYQLGIASVVDVLTVEDRLTTAMTTEVQAQLAYALALAQFRFATGTIVAPGKAVVSLDAAVFRTLPQPDLQAHHP